MELTTPSNKLGEFIVGFGLFLDNEKNLIYHQIHPVT